MVGFAVAVTVVVAVVASTEQDEVAVNVCEACAAGCYLDLRGAYLGNHVAAYGAMDCCRGSTCHCFLGHYDVVVAVAVVADAEVVGTLVEALQDAVESEVPLQAVVVDGFYYPSYQMGKTD